MSSLLKLPNNDKFTIQKITPLDANWNYVGFEVYDLHEGQKLKDKSNQREFCVVLLSGTAYFSTSKNNFGIMKGRSNVFEKIPPIAMYVPKDEAWEILAKENCEIAVCTAPSVKGKYNSRVKEKNTRTIPHSKVKTPQEHQTRPNHQLTPLDYPPMPAAANATPHQPKVLRGEPDKSWRR